MREITDSMNYESLIRSVFPNTIIEKVSNFDDLHWGFRIVPRAEVLLYFEVRLDEPMRIRIRGKQIHMNSERDATKEPVKTLFFGTIPANADYEPDFNFISQLLKNYKCFMY